MYLSAAEAILPAIRRTRKFLFQPFRWGTYLKLCLVALLTEGLGGNNRFSGPGEHHAPNRGPELHPPFHFHPEWIPLLIGIFLFVLVVGLVLFYLITRLRFAYFHCLTHNIREIRPGWRLYRTQAGRFFRLNIVVGLCFFLGFLAIVLPFASGVWRLVRETQAGVHPGVGAILALVLPIIPLILLLVVAAFAADMVLRDFMLPHYALENATPGQAWSEVWARIRDQKGPFFVYALLRIVLPIIGAIVLFAVLLMPGIVFVAGVAVVEVGIHSVLSGATGAALALEILVGVVSFAIALVVGLCFGGPLSTATREYALIFYGGRYQPLGDILYPPPAPSQT
jgi:hypothetical protein